MQSNDFSIAKNSVGFSRKSLEPSPDRIAITYIGNFMKAGRNRPCGWADFKGVRLNMAGKPNGPIELYNLKTDIGEKHNTAA